MKSRLVFHIQTPYLLQFLYPALLFFTVHVWPTSGASVATPQPATNSTFYPLLPPAIPLAVKSPYISAWLATGKEGGNGGYLAGRWAQFWPIQFPQNAFAYRLGWAGLIRVHGKTYEFMGQPNDDNIGNQNLRATQVAFECTPSRSVFTMEAGGVRFMVTFLSSLPTAGDLLRQSLPFSYLSIELVEDKSSSGSTREYDPVMIYTDIQADWASGNHNVTATWSHSDTGKSLSYHIGRKDQLLFSEQNEYAEWGQAVYATDKISGLTTASGVASELRKEFVSQGKLSGTQDKNYRAISDQTSGFGFSVPLGRGTEPVVFAIGHVRDPYVQSIERVSSGDNSGTMVQKWGYWRSKFSQTTDAIDFFLGDYFKAIQAAIEIDKRIIEDAKRLGGDAHAAIVSVSARQAVGSMELTIGKDSAGNFDPSNVAAFIKEISSNGDMSTLDVIFPQFPILSYLDPALLRLTLEPIFKYTESGLYPNKWTVHDLGRYPNATGHNDGKDEPMPVEEAGNILIMVLSYYQLTKDANWLRKHYNILKQWAQFLVNGGLVPEEQLSSDDFAGKLANQTNLALKAIVGIGAMSQIALATGDKDEASKLRSTAEDYISKWSKYALADNGQHTKLAYQLNDSWGTLYNLFADRLLNLKLVPQSIYDKQDHFYPSVANDYGVPLDNRHTWAKTDWQMFAAAASISTQTRDLFIGKLVKYLQANKVNGGFPDLYETQTAEYPGRSSTSTWRIEFINRPVVGAHFAILALDKANKANGVTEFPFNKRTS
ncbi:hypothetical protein PCANC_23157 [Puccinia coronata f. sp. avenae]|uniref:Glutaminase n=1 Tax=Puccinia coronata f. sp. avenae TaxID=200324 RepID=A0A2N5SB36_9BASI|nr:hypothetical protein PCANC_23157 [Puccinia coronata f. sp. avenae]